MANAPQGLAFNADGLLPVGDYQMTLDELAASVLVVGSPAVWPVWDMPWRAYLVSSLKVMVMQLWHVGIDQIFIDGSFVEDKAHPNDIDGYFGCDLQHYISGRLSYELNTLDPYHVWTWDPFDRRPHQDSVKNELPMWHRYRVELYPHYGQRSGILDQFGNEQEFPAAFRTTKYSYHPKGIIQIIR